MVVGLLGNESPDSNIFTLVTPKPENGVRLQATLQSEPPQACPWEQSVKDRLRRTNYKGARQKSKLSTKRIKIRRKKPGYC